MSDFDKALRIIDSIIAGEYVPESDLLWLRSIVEDYEFYSRVHEYDFVSI